MMIDSPGNAAGGATRSVPSLRLEPGLLWLTPGLVFMGLLFIVPIALIIWASFTDPSLSLDHYAETFGNPLYRKVLVNTIVSAVGATIGCLAIGYPTAYAIYRAGGRLRMVMLIV